MEKVRIFDGEDAHDIGIEYFFQNPVIERIHKGNVIHYYKATWIYKHTLKDVIEVMDSSETGEIRKMIAQLSATSKGLHMLRQMVLDLLGDQEGEATIAILEEMIKDELYE
jgi:hypothetical protein